MKKVLLRFVVTPVAVLASVVLVAYTLSYASLFWPDSRKPFYVALANRGRPAVFSHQGGEGIRPTNTAIAFKDSREMGADVLDGDLHMSSDGMLVLAHDETIDRTSNGKGAIRDMTYSQLKAYDFGYQFTTDNGATYPYRGQGLEIVKLDDLFRSYPSSLFGIEIKQTTEQAATKLCEMIALYGYEDKVLVSSFLEQNMVQFRKDCPDVATSGTPAETKKFFVYHTIGLAGLYRAPFDSLQVPEYSGKTHVLTSRFVSDAQQKGYMVVPWTINDSADIQRISAMGVDGINTNYPDRMISIKRGSL